MILEIVQAKDPSLRKKSKPVKKIDKKILKLIEDMKETLLVQDDPEGVGLAAPQVGKNIRLFMMKPENVIRVVINPEVVSVSEEKDKKSNGDKKIMEGCLSLPHFYGPLERAAKITIKFQDVDGNTLTETFKNFEAQIVQHELDHLDGILFVDRLLEAKKPLYEWVGNEWERVEI